jgi:[acyl-carrier-protein] S-malonyltransferase
MAKIAFLFPGQGSQAVGMGKDVYEQYASARKVIDLFNEQILPDLRSVTFEGPEETLKRTLYTQPAILSISLALLTVFQEKGYCQPSMAAGHSLGEYAALCAAGVIDLETAAKLIKKRAELMENAPAGGMAAILGLSQDNVEKAVLHVRSLQGGIVTLANYNAPEQFVISGERVAVEAVCDYARQELKAMKAILLPVGGAFHSPLMAEAGQTFATYIQNFSFQDARFPVVTNCDAQMTTRSKDFSEKLVDQIASPVRWLDGIRLMHQEGVDTFIEIGPGKVLTGMIKRIYKEARLFNIYDAASLENTLEALKERIPLS